MVLQIVIHNGLVLLVILHHSEVHSYELIVYKKATHLSESAKNHSIGSDSKSKNSAQGRIWRGGQVAKWVAKFGNGTAVSVRANLFKPPYFAFFFFFSFQFEHWTKLFMKLYYLYFCAIYFIPVLCTFIFHPFFPSFFFVVGKSLFLSVFVGKQK